MPVSTSSSARSPTRPATVCRRSRLPPARPTASPGTSELGLRQSVPLGNQHVVHPVPQHELERRHEPAVGQLVANKSKSAMATPKPPRAAEVEVQVEYWPLRQTSRQADGRTSANPGGRSSGGARGDARDRPAHAMARGRARGPARRPGQRFPAQTTNSGFRRSPRQSRVVMPRSDPARRKSA